MKNKLLLAIIVLAAILRLPLLDKYPAGLNADEAAIGYNAWSLIQTGRDEHGAGWPLAFRSFDDYKPPVYFYLVLPFVALLGPTVWAVRLPSALLGVASVYLVYLLVKKLFPNKKYLPEIASFLLASSPWHLHFSRGGWEVNAASFFLLAGTYFFLKASEKQKYYLLSVISYALSMYTYHSARLVVPFLGLSLLLLYRPQFKKLILPGLVGLIMVMPLLFSVVSPQGRSRFSGVSVFADEGPLWEALELRRGHPTGSFTAKVLHNRYASYFYRFGKNYLSHFSPRFLYIVGDEIGRSRVPGMGQAYLFSAPFFILGLLTLFKKGDKGAKLILTWLFIAPLAAALTFQSPHALRAQNMVIPLTVVTAYGIFEFLTFLHAKKIHLLLLTACCLLLATVSVYELARYLHLYYIHYPKEIAYAWQYGFDQIAQKVESVGDRYDKIIISDRYDQPYILMAFYLRYPPEKLQRELVMTPRDKFGFSTVRNFSKFEFHRIDWGVDSQSPNTLIIAADEGAPEEAVVDRIYDPAGKVMYRFFDTGRLQ